MKWIQRVALTLFLLKAYLLIAALAQDREAGMHSRGFTFIKPPTIIYMINSSCISNTTNALHSHTNCYIDHAILQYSHFKTSFSTISYHPFEYILLQVQVHLKLMQEEGEMNQRIHSRLHYFLLPTYYQHFGAKQNWMEHV